MRVQQVDQRLADRLLALPGWERVLDPPRYLIEHAAAGVQVLVFPGDIAVEWRGPGGQHLAVSVKTAFFPEAAITAILEVAEALVIKQSGPARPTRPSGRKGQLGLPSGDMLVLIAAQRPGVTLEQAQDDPQWVTAAGWLAQPALSTIRQAFLELSAAGLIRGPRGTRQLTLTEDGWHAARSIAHRLGVSLPGPRAAAS